MAEALTDRDVLSLSSLRLLLSPLQLMSAALWGVVQHRAVMHYGLLEDFITAVLDFIPDLLCHSEREQLVLGLRAKVVLEMCRSDDLCCRQNVEPHLTRIDDLIKEQKEEEASSSKMKASMDNFLKVLDDPYEKAMFYQETFPSVFGSDFDSALCDLVRKFLMNLEKLLPVPSLDQTSLWLGLSPPVLKECGDILNQPEPLRELLQHHKQDCTFSPGPIVTDLNFSSLSGQQNSDEGTESKITLLNCSYTVKVEKPFVVEENEDDVPSIEVTLDESDTDPQDCTLSVPNVDQTHSDHRRTFKCFVCDQTFSSLSELKKHIIPRCSADTVEKNFAECLSSRFVISTNTSDGQMCKRSSRSKTCSVCGEAFTSSTDLINHMRAHTEYGSQVCGECGEDFDSYEDFMFHQKNGCRRSNGHSVTVDYNQEMQQRGIKDCVVLLRRMPDDRAISPQICTISRKDCGRRVLKSGLKTHQRMCFQRMHTKESLTTTNSSNVIWIKPCKLNSFTSLSESDSKLNQSSVKSPNTTSSQQSIMKCTVCDETFSKMLLLKSHYRYRHKVKGPYQCSICQRPFVRLCELVLHHSDKSLCQCNTCKRCFTLHSYLLKHKKQFNDTCATAYICEICGKSCISPAVLKCHKHYAHDRPKETTVCSYCGKEFSSKYCLRVHMNRHTGGFSCSICSKVFFQKIYLTRHMQKHNGIPLPYLCDICGKDFPCKSYLKLHMVEHSQERPFKCDQCGMAYKTESTLKAHFLIKHTDHRPYVCSICSVGFKYSNMLKDHMIKHTGVRPHVCSKCGKRFVRMCHLKVHQKTKCAKPRDGYRISKFKQPSGHVSRSTWSDMF